MRTGLGRRLLLSCPDPGWRRVVNWEDNTICHGSVSRNTPTCRGLPRRPLVGWLVEGTQGGLAAASASLLIDRHYYNSKNASPDARAPARVRRVRSVAVRLKDIPSPVHAGWDRIVGI